MRTKKLTSLLLVIMIVGSLVWFLAVQEGIAQARRARGETVVASVLQA